MAVDLERLGSTLANYSAMVLISAFVFSLAGMLTGFTLGNLGSLPLIGWIGYLTGSVGYFLYRRYERQGTAKYDQQIELVSLLGSLILSPLLGMIVGGLLYLIGRME